MSEWNVGDKCTLKNEVVFLPDDWHGVPLVIKEIIMGFFALIVKESDPESETSVGLNHIEPFHDGSDGQLTTVNPDGTVEQFITGGVFMSVSGVENTSESIGREVVPPPVNRHPGEETDLDDL